MKILIAGLTKPSTHAIEFVAHAIWPKASFVKLYRTTTFSMPEPNSGGGLCDLFVMDLMGLGTPRWSPDYEAALKTFLADRPSILLVPAGSGGGWFSALKAKEWANTPVLQHPVSASDLRAAMNEIFQRQNKIGALLEAEITASELIAVQARAEELEAIAKSHKPSASQKGKGRLGAPVAPSAPAAPVITGVFFPPIQNSYTELGRSFPVVGNHPYWKMLGSIVTVSTPHELRLTEKTGAVFYPGQNWVCSNISKVFQQRLLENDLMMDVVTVRPISEVMAQIQSAHLFGNRRDGRRPLDSFLWILAYKFFEKIPMQVEGDVEFRMTRFPDFTRLPAAPDLFIQMALVCMRGHHSLSGLKKTFARHDPNLINLFVACILLSGMATMLGSSHAGARYSPPMDDDTASVMQTAPADLTPTVETIKKRGFFRSLLDKLF